VGLFLFYSSVFRVVHLGAFSFFFHHPCPFFLSTPNRQLYDVLSHSALAAARTPVLLACHKADLGIKAHSVDFLKKRLEKELDMMRQTRVALGGGGGREATAGLGPSGEPFSFNALARVRGPRVTAAATSAADAGGLVEIEAFIRACAAW
jgi:signal recognition particle receptor subunit beta